MKKRICMLLVLILVISLLPMTTFAAEENDIGEFELPKPAAPNYFVFTDGDEKEGCYDDLRMYMVVDSKVVDLTSEYYSYGEEFCEKYGVNSFYVYMQYDVSLDSTTDWQYTPEWDSWPFVGGYASGFMAEGISNYKVEDFEFFWLVYYEGLGSETFVPYQPAITTYVYHHEDWDENIYSFDTTNHSLNIRCRYIMEWETPDYETHYKTSEWSDIATFGKNSTQILLEEPTSYEAPVISDLKINYEDNGEWYYISFEQDTPDSVWDADLYYMMNDYFEPLNLDSQVSINGGEWTNASVANSQWATNDGERVLGFDGIDEISFETNIKLRVRFSGPAGVSAWSNVLEVNGGDTQNPEPPEEPEQPEEPEETKKIPTTPMYRLYNPNTGEHFYTGSTVERDMLVEAGWHYEGVAWNAPIYSGTPVFRVYNPNSGDHHYTMSQEEVDMLVELGWQYEGVAWNSAPANHPEAIPLYRLYNPNADCGSHHYTGSVEEREFLVTLGWIYEGIGWFGMLK